MKVIFLDIDGVMNSFHDHVKPEDKTYAGPFWYADNISSRFVKKLNNIISETSAQIVISSSWRKKFSIEIIEEIFNQHGFEGKIISSTPSLKRDKEGNILDRGDEIKNWLDNNTDVKKFVVIDDFDYYHFDKWFSKEFIHVQDNKGLQEEHVSKAIELLNKE